MRYIIYTSILLIAAILVALPVSAADARNYRIVGNQRYEILEARALYIYSADVLAGRLVTNEKIYSSRRNREKAYFFSVGPNGEIVPLTIINLKKAFPGNHVFHDNLDMTFDNDSQLTKYDDFHKMFKVNRLMIASQQ